MVILFIYLFDYLIIRLFIYFCWDWYVPKLSSLLPFFSSLDEMTSDFHGLRLYLQSLIRFNQVLDQINSNSSYFSQFFLLLKFITYYNFRFSGIQRFIFEDYKPFTESRNWCYSGNGKEAFTNNTNISVHYSHPFHRNCQDGKKLLIFFVNKILMIFTMFHYYVILLSYFVFI